MPDHPSGFRTPARLFHWGIAVAVLLMIPAGLIMTQEGLPRSVQDALFLFHKNLGTLLIPIILARVLYRLFHKPPPLPASVPHWQQRIAKLSHLTLYVLLIVMPLSGFIRVGAGGFPIELLDRLGAGPWLAKSESIANAAQTTHKVAAFLLIALLALHIAAAIYHAVVRRDGVWPQMWPPVSR